MLHYFKAFKNKSKTFKKKMLLHHIICCTTVWHRISVCWDSNAASTLVLIWVSLENSLMG